MSIQLVESTTHDDRHREIHPKTSRIKAHSSFLDKCSDNRERDQTEYTQSLVRLRRLGVTIELIEKSRRNSYQNGSTLVRELIANGDLDEAAYYRHLADDLSLKFIEVVDANTLILSGDRPIKTLSEVGTVRCLGENGRTFLLAAPSESELAIMLRALQHTPDLARSICITTPNEFDRAILARFCMQQVKEAVNELPLERPEFSAKEVLTPIQGFFLGVATVLLPVFAWQQFRLFLLLSHIAASLLFAGCVLLRVRAAGNARALSNQCKENISIVEGPYPIYSIMVALYKEAAIVPQLCAQLQSLNWPKSRMEILLICEESDAETIEALRMATKPGIFKIILVPRFGPQTKPRALSFALPLTRGEFVVVYDAEDRPHPDQLKEAYGRFQREAMNIACLQSPLSITNGSQTLLSRMFAFEYSALFGGLLPYLAENACFIPLGGTSNHFRRSVLMEIGRWDPYNVTEDADLGTRLFRLGYRTGMLTNPTMEDAPVRLSQWLPQRTRWLKGWMQTWLVHMRRPRDFCEQAGFDNFLHFQILTIGMVLSALIYPIMLVEMGWQLTSIFLHAGYGMTNFGLAIFIIDFANVLLGHLSFVQLGAKTEGASTRFATTKVALALPVYWALLSAAAWRGLWQLFFRPHLWEKTEHFPTALADKGTQ